METMMTLLILRLVVEIQIGFLNAEVIPELSRYETEDWVRSGPRHVMSSQISEVRKYIYPSHQVQVGHDTERVHVLRRIRSPSGNQDLDTSISSPLTHRNFQNCIKAETPLNLNVKC